MAIRPYGLDLVLLRTCNTVLDFEECTGPAEPARYDRDAV